MLKKFNILLLVFGILNLNLNCEEIDNSQSNEDSVCILSDFFPEEDLNLLDDVSVEDNELSLKQKIDLLVQFKYLESKEMVKDQWELTKEQFKLIQEYWQQYLALGLVVVVIGGVGYLSLK